MAGTGTATDPNAPPTAPGTEPGKLFTQDQPDPNAAPKPGKLDDPEVQLAIEKARNEVLQSQLDRGPIAPASGPVPGRVTQRLPNDWRETLTTDEQKWIEENQITNSSGVADFIARRSQWVTEIRAQAFAQPLIAAQAQSIVSQFTATKRGSDQYAAQVEPIFMKVIRDEGDISGLVNMSAEVQHARLDQIWRAAKSEVLERVVKEPPRTDPTLTAPGGGVSAPGNNTAKPDLFVDDPIMAAMNEKYKFTDEQKAEIEARNR